MDISFHSCLRELEKIEQSIDSKYADNSKLLDKNVGMALIFKNIISNIKFLESSDKDECNTQCFVTLSRMIIDNYSIFYLLTSYSSEEEKKLRYYLYLIDSFQSRIKTIENYSEGAKNNKLIQKFDTSHETITHDQRVICLIQEKIKLEKLGSLFPQNQIDKYNWKYSNGKGHSKNGPFSWEELYKIAKIQPHHAKLVQAHYSTYAHGLAMTFLYTERNKTLINSIFLFLISIQFYMAKIIIRELDLNVEKIKLSAGFITLMNEYWKHNLTDKE